MVLNWRGSETLKLGITQIGKGEASLTLQLDNTNG